MEMDPIRVLLVDDHPVVRHGLQSLLSLYLDICVVGEADNALTALESVDRLKPDVILLDIRLENANGLDIARQVRYSQARARIIVLTSYEDENYLLEAARIGVDGYLLKNASAEVLADAIRAVHLGEGRLSPALAGKALGQLRALTRSRVQSESGLTDQELQLLQLIAGGVSTQEITQKLYWSERTIKRKTKDILIKLNATSRAQAVAEAFKRGLL